MEIESLTTCTSRNGLRLGRNRGHHRWWQSCRGGGGERRAWVRSLQWEYQKGGAHAARSACFFFCCCVVLLSLLLMPFVRFTRHSSVTLRRKRRRRHKFGSFLEKTTRAEEGGTQADPPFTWPEYPPALTGPETWPWKCHRIRCGSWRRSEPISASGQRERERDWKNHKWLVRFRKVIVKWIDGRFNRDWEGKVRVLERDREREQLTIRVLQRKKWEK